MKKILTLLITLLLVLSIAGCNSPATDTELEDRVATLEAQVLELQELQELNSRTVMSVGLNGQTDYYINPSEPKLLSLMSYTNLVSTEKDYLDKSKFPNYIWDLNGDYISVEQLNNLLAQKYFGNVTGTIFETGDKYQFIFNFDTDMSEEEFMVRMSMLVIELSSYDFYILDASQLHIYVLLNDTPVEIKIRMSLLVNDSYTLHPAIFWNGLMDTDIDGINYSKLALEDIYTDYETNETFDGYVLDYN